MQTLYAAKMDDTKKGLEYCNVISK